MDFYFLKILAVIFLIFFLIWVLYRFLMPNELKLISPNGGEVLRAGNTYNIRWKATNIGKVDIVLVNEDKPKTTKVIAKSLPAGKRVYKWKIFAWEKPSQRYKISIFQSPWREGKAIDYSDHYFTILGPVFASCEQLLIERNWPFIPSDFPNIRGAFLTHNAYSGNLGGLEGADNICQKEAEDQGLKGNWKAFLGDDNTSAKERLDLSGIFVYAKREGGLPQEKLPAYFWSSFGKYLDNISKGNKRLKKSLYYSYNALTGYFGKFYQRWNNLEERKTCYPFLGKDFNDFFNKLSSPLLVKEGEGGFLASIKQEIWLGRINKGDKKNCINISSEYAWSTPSERYSFTSTCQNWTTNKDKVGNSQLPPGQTAGLPECYTPAGGRIDALGLAGAALTFSKKGDEQISNLSLGRSCNSALKLLCIQQ